MNNIMYKETITSIRLLVTTDYCSRCVFFKHIPCVLMCVLFYFSFI